jgi:hypothetical protein
MREVATRVAEVMLHVTDQRIVPIRKINRAIRPHPMIHRTERRVRGHDDRRHRLHRVAGAVIGEFPAPETILFKRRGHQASAPFIGEMTSAENFTTGKFSITAGNRQRG